MSEAIYLAFFARWLQARIFDIDALSGTQFNLLKRAWLAATPGQHVENWLIYHGIEALQREYLADIRAAWAAGIETQRKMANGESPSPSVFSPEGDIIGPAEFITWVKRVFDVGTLTKTQFKFIHFAWINACESISFKDWFESFSGPYYEREAELRAAFIEPKSQLSALLKAAMLQAWEAALPTKDSSSEVAELSRKIKTYEENIVALLDGYAEAVRVCHKGMGENLLQSISVSFIKLQHAVNTLTHELAKQTSGKVILPDGNVASCPAEVAAAYLSFQVSASLK